MTNAVSSRPARFDAYWVLPALAILCVQVALYIWMAPRGFDFTDESYYLHSFLHWREFTGNVTFFGAYFEWPFRAMGGSLAGIRLLSLALVTGSGAILMHSVLRFSLHGQSGHAALQRGPVPWYYLVAPAAASMMYFGYLSNLRAPSYNLLSLCTIALATACLLRTLVQEPGARPARLAPFVYGVALGACLLSKATTALILVIGHAAFFAAFNRTWTWKRIREILVLSLAGFALNFAVLTAVFPDWLASLREGVELVRVRGGYGLTDMLRNLSWEVQRVLVSTGPWLAGLVVLFYMVRRKLGPADRGAISVLAVLVTGISVAVIAAAYLTNVWLFVMIAAALALWSLEQIARPQRGASATDRAELALMALLFFLPVAFSFGTNTSLLSHSAIASLFVYCALFLRLYRLSYLGVLTRGALALSVGLLCVPALLQQALALTDVRYTYRQLAPQGGQDTAVAVGAPATVMHVDERTGKSLNDIRAMVRAAGLEPGDHVLDFSGDGPGFIYAAGASPLGSPWMIGGYAGSAAAAERVVGKLGPAAVRNAWLLTSTNNPRRIRGWEAIMARHAGPGSHRLAGSVTIAAPYAWDASAPRHVQLQLWKPAAPAPR